MILTEAGLPGPWKHLKHFTRFASVGTLRFFQLFIILTVPLAKLRELRRRLLPTQFLTNIGLASAASGCQVCLQGRTKDKPTWKPLSLPPEPGALFLSFGAFSLRGRY